MSAGDIKRNMVELLKAGGYDDEALVPYSTNLAETSKEVQRRIRALKKYQLESIGLESKFYERVHQLEKEFQTLFSVVNEKRKAIVSGDYQPTDEECNIALVHGLPEDELQKLENDAPIEGSPSKGIPNFWYHALNNTSLIGDSIHEYDVPILKYMSDITLEIHSDPTGYSLFFHFAENPYFANAVLKKSYEQKITPDEDEPFAYDGPTIIKCQGTEINWKEGKNVTQKVVKKKQKKGSGAGRFITKTVTNESFFNFFDPALKELTEDMEPEPQEALRTDFEIGQVIRDQIIPRAVLFFTGEGVDDDGDFDDFDEDGEDDSDGDDDEDED